MAKTEDDIKRCYQKVDELENKLHGNKISEEVSQVIKTELNEVRKLLETHETRLNELRKANRKSFLLVAAIVFIIFAIYMMYILIFGLDDEYF